MRDLQDELDIIHNTGNTSTRGSGLTEASALAADLRGECGTSMDRDRWPMGGSAEETFLERVFPRLKFRWELGQEKYKQNMMSRYAKDFDTESDCIVMSLEGT